MSSCGLVFKDEEIVLTSFSHNPPNKYDEYHNVLKHNIKNVTTRTESSLTTAKKFIKKFV